MLAPRIISPTRLDAQRELIDEHLAFSRIFESCCLDSACDKFVNQFDLKLRFTNGPGGATLAWLDPLYPLTIYPDHQGLPGMEEILAGRPYLIDGLSFLFASERRCWAVSRSDAVLGACCLAIDDNAQIFQDKYDSRRSLPWGFVRMLELAELLIADFQRAPGDRSPLTTCGQELPPINLISIVRTFCESLTSLSSQLHGLAVGPERRFHASVTKLMQSSEDKRIDADSLDHRLITERDQTMLGLLGRLSTPMRQDAAFLNLVARRVSPAASEIIN